DLVVESDRYYLIGWQIKYSSPVNFRLDKMEKIEELDEIYETREFDVSAYMNQTFRMFNGEKVNVTLRCSNDLYEEVSNQFGRDMIVTERQNDSFLCNVNAALSPTFYSWVFTFQGKAVIVSPQRVRDEFANVCRQMINLHQPVEF
ncbi:MAG: WYL domain-containing protein, partial [Erysipelotrichaceae bacterium]|nr:WYL domain-containing protein [Erysipelotrichaceae bacterium]